MSVAIRVNSIIFTILRFRRDMSNARVIRCISKKTELWPWENNAWLKTIQFIEENKNSPTGTGLGGVVGGKVGGGGGASENQLRSVNKEFSHIATDLLQQR